MKTYQDFKELLNGADVIYIHPKVGYINGTYIVDYIAIEEKELFIGAEIGIQVEEGHRKWESIKESINFEKANQNKGMSFILDTYYQIILNEIKYRQTHGNPNWNDSKVYEIKQQEDKTMKTNKSNVLEDIYEVLAGNTMYLTQEQLIERYGDIEINYAQRKITLGKYTITIE